LPSKDAAPLDLDHRQPTLDSHEALDSMFERVALSQPNRVAIRSIEGSVSVSYEALLAAARRIAAALVEAGLECGQLVGIMIACSAEGALAILGTVFAHGAYVPLDPSSPRLRLEQLIERAQLQLVVTRLGSNDAAWLASSRSGVCTLEVGVPTADGDLTVRIGGGQHLSPFTAAETASSAASEDRLVYVLFTSGSTGQSKGVPGYQSGICARLAHWWAEFPYAQDEKAGLLHITFTWVDHVTQLWSTLLSGRELIIVPDATALLGMIDSAPPAVHRLLLVPSMLRAMLDKIETLHLLPPRFLSLVMVSGEPMPAPLLRRYRALVPDGRLVNVYGMTEVRGVHV